MKRILIMTRVFCTRLWKNILHLKCAFSSPYLLHSPFSGPPPHTKLTMFMAKYHFFPILVEMETPPYELLSITLYIVANIFAHSSVLTSMLGLQNGLWKVLYKLCYCVWLCNPQFQARPCGSFTNPIHPACLKWQSLNIPFPPPHPTPPHPSLAPVPTPVCKRWTLHLYIIIISLIT